MRSRDRAALTMGPLLIRLPLALIFLWAGLGKLIADTQIGPEQAVILSAAGVRLPDGAAPPEDDTPTLDQPLDNPDTDPAADPADPPPTDSPQDSADDEAPAPAQPESGDDESDAGETDADDTGTPPEATEESLARAPADAPARITLAAFQAGDDADDAAAATDDSPAADEPITVRRVNMLILLMHERSQPGVSASDGSPTPAVWPKALMSGPWPKVLAWAACFTEIFAGFFLLLGLLTRLSAFSLTCVMGVAMWLATFGPAIQTDTAMLGFLPSHAAWSYEWKDLFFQLIIFMAALALVFMGPGAAALDRAIFAPRADEDDWDDDATPQSLRDRHSFDRSP